MKPRNDYRDEDKKAVGAWIIDHGITGWLRTGTRCQLYPIPYLACIKAGWLAGWPAGRQAGRLATVAGELAI